ncbi:MAG: ABC transporter ATP-binding protein [Pirellulales bacterium]|nr:ABC transporter ATP-binding protein [Pirellulales bacterium]
MSLLSVRDLAVEFHTSEGVVRAVAGISYDLEKGQTLGIVGESGSGKSVGVLALLGLIPQPSGKIVSGSAIYAEKDLLRLTQRELQLIRGRRIAMIFQDPLTALNPYLPVAEQLTEVTRHHLRHTAGQAHRHAVELLNRVGIPGASRRIYDYPHQFSGGMRQRVMIAMALACQPDILIADEPTTALDVTIQAQIMELLANLQSETGMALVLITHDLGLVAGHCDQVKVMYAGKFVEEAAVAELFSQPRHPYTRGLLDSLPSVAGRTQRLVPIPGQPPDLTALPPGCPFGPRCAFRASDCETAFPPVTELAAEHRYACWHPCAANGQV